MGKAESPFMLSAFRSFPGRAEKCRDARLWIRDLTRGFPDAADAVEVVVSELFGNAITHTASGRPGGRVEVSLVALASGSLHLEVTDQGKAATRAVPMQPDPGRAGGCGLFLVEALAAEWGRLPAEADPCGGVFAETPHDYTGPMITWADFRTRPHPWS